jgi:hypothetical protein
MLPDTGIDDVKKQRNAEYAKHINDPVLSSLKMEGIRLLFRILWTAHPSRIQIYIGIGNTNYISIVLNYR